MDSYSAIFANSVLDYIYTVRKFSVNSPFKRAGHYANFLYTGLKILVQTKSRSSKLNFSVYKESLTTGQANMLE